MIRVDDSGLAQWRNRDSSAALIAGGKCVDTSLVLTTSHKVTVEAMNFSHGEQIACSVNRFLALTIV